MDNKMYEMCIKNIKEKYGSDLEIGFRFNREENKIYLLYFSEKIDFLDDDLLYDLYTQIDEILIPNGLKNVSIFFDSEKEYIDINKKSLIVKSVEKQEIKCNKNNSINNKYALCA